MADSYDEAGNYIFPEGFDADTNEWLEGFEKQRDEWEARYARPSVVTRCTPPRWRSSPRPMRSSQQACDRQRLVVLVLVSSGDSGGGTLRAMPSWPTRRSWPVALNRPLIRRVMKPRSRILLRGFALL